MRTPSFQRVTAAKWLVMCATVSGFHGAYAQTAPVFETAPAATTEAPTETAAWNSAPDDVTDVQFKAPDTVQIANDERANLGRALQWNYNLGATVPEISLPAAPLNGARSLSFRLKTSVPTALELWFETARGDDETKPAIRYAATVWTSGEWQTIELDAARFVRTETGVNQSSDATIWREDWNRIARYGVRDVTNAWRKRIGQVSQTGARQLWLDEVEVSARPATNALMKPVVTVVPQPAAPVADEEEEVEIFGPPGFDEQAPPVEFTPRRTDRVLRQVDPNYRPQPRPADVLGGDEDEGDDIMIEGDSEEADNDEPETPIEPTVTLAQDAWGAPELWLPINGTTASKAGDRAGLSWNYTRLANRETLLLTTLNASLLNLPAAGLIAPARDPRVVLRVQSPRLARLVLDIETQKMTRLNISLHERNGAIYSQSITLDPRNKRQRVSLLWTNFKREQTTRDANDTLDINQLEALSLSDNAAQKGWAGPNEIGLYGVTWVY